MRVKVSELEGATLDWAVAKACGVVAYTQTNGPLYLRDTGKAWHPSTDWSQGGPLIDRYGVGFVPMEKEILASTNRISLTGRESGSTHLIAAMRAIVAAEFGEEIDIPEALA